MPGTSVCSDALVLHGPYRREDFAKLTAEIRPHFAAILSIWPETYCHALTECWSCGLPVLAFGTGAVGERIVQHGGGWLVPEISAQAVLTEIARIRSCPDEFHQRCADVTAWQETEGRQRTCRQMAERYFDFYRGLMVPSGAGQQRPVVAVATPDTSWINGVVNAPASTHIRILERIGDRLDRAVRYELVDPKTLLETPMRGCFDAVLVQRNAFRNGSSDRLIDATARAGVPIILEMDDDLIERARIAREGDPYWKSGDEILRLAEASSLIVTTTETLADRMKDRCARVVVSPNVLSPRLWSSPVGAGEDGADIPPALEQRIEGEVRAIYMGTKTHDRDLLLLERAVRSIRRDFPNFRFFVVGVTEGDVDWCERLVIPAGHTVYPRFVVWFRKIAARMDFAVAPLEGNRFNAGKSDLKSLDYAGAGLCGLYSKVAPYSAVIEHGRTGVLVDNDSKSWENALRAALSNVAKLKRVGEANRAALRIRETFDAEENRVDRAVLEAIQQSTVSRACAPQ
jgi:glycosyltransferase involved in cell wall biosynthesis